jgi:putative serine protease PepD
VSQLEVVADGRRYLFDEDAVVSCGRSSESQVTLTDRRVGRAHSRLWCAEGVWYLSDLDTVNGTWIDGERITSRRIDGDTTAYLGNPRDGALLFLRLHPHGAPVTGVPADTGPAGAAPPADPAVADAPTEAAPVTSAAYNAPTGPQPIVTLAPQPPSQPASAPPASAPPASAPPAAQPYPLGPPPTVPIPPPPLPPGPMPPAPMPPGFMPPGSMPPAYRPPGYPPVPARYGPGAGWRDTSDAAYAIPVLVLRLGTRTHIFPVGQPVRVGRDLGLEAVTDHPLVSRNYHGVVVSDLHGATYTDTSSRGSYLDGKPLKGPLRITEPVTLRLGDPATGEELGITPPLSVARMQSNRRRRARRGRWKVAAAIVAALALLGVGAVVAFSVGSSRDRGGNAAPSALSEATLHRAEAATVRLLIGTESNFAGWGSGTVISRDGLILTNAHVAAPRTLGQAVGLAAPGSSLDPNPPFVTVEFTTGEAAAVVPKYRAKVVAADGYLDLAVLRIFATDSGTPVDPASLDLTFLPVGTVNDLNLGEHVTVLGYPGVSGSDSITVTSGVLSTFIPDPLGHVADPRFQLETTARVAHGNSGGATITDNGTLIGVPSLSIPGEGSDLSWRLRSVTEAAPLIAAGRAGTTYTSTLLVALTGGEQVAGAGVGDTPDQACGGSVTATGGAHAVFAFRFAGLPVGVDIAFLIALPDGTTVTTSALMGQSLPGLPEFTVHGATGCVAYTVSAAEQGLAVLPAGAYRAQLLGGPNLDPISNVAILTVG